MSVRRFLFRRIEQLESRNLLTNIRVAFTTDNGDPTATGTLSWAIAAANAIWDNGGVQPASGAYSNSSDKVIYQGTTYDLISSPAALPITIYFDLLAYFNPGADTIVVNGALPTISAPIEIDGMISPTTGLRATLDGNKANNGTLTSVGLRYEGLDEPGAGHFEVRDLIIDNFDSAPLQIRSLSSGDTVSLNNLYISNNGNPGGGSAGINFLDTPSGSGSLTITGSTIRNNFNAAINIVDADGISSSSSVVSQITGNTIFQNTTPSGTKGIHLGSGAANINISGNTITTVNESPITIESSASSQIKISNNTLQVVPAQIGSGIVPPIDLRDDGIVDLPDPNDADLGPNGMLNPPTILTNEVYQSGGNFGIPFATEFASSGNYRFELYKFVAATSTWSLVDDAVINSIPAGITRQVMHVPTSLISLNTVISMIAIGESGANNGNTSEFAYPSTTTAHVLVDNAPVIKNVYFSGSTWGATRIAISSLISLNAQTAPLYWTGTSANTGVDRIDLVLSEPVSINTSRVRVKSSDPVNSVSIPDQIIENFDNNPLTHDYRLVFASRLPSDKYILEIDDTVTDLGIRNLDGEWDAVYGQFDNYFDDLLPSLPGDGQAGGTARIRFAVLYGDANSSGFVSTVDSDDFNLDGLVNSSDSTIRDNVISTGRKFLPATTRTGDYNDDDVVDENDYYVWRLAFGTSQANHPADGNGNGTIDAADYTPWQDNFGASSIWSGASSAGGGSGGMPVFDPLNVPRVANLTISGSNSLHAPYSFDGHDGSGEQLRTVPVGGADTISITFTEDVNITADTLSLVGMRTANRPNLVEFDYDISSMTASWRFTGWTFGDQYLISLSDTVTDLEGNHLNGEWTNPTSLTTVNAAISEFPSGDGYAGGDFNFVATLLPGDANLDLVVNSLDYAIWSSHYGANDLFSEGDFDGNGYVDTSDILLYYAHQSDNLTSLQLLADLNGDWAVDQDDSELLYDNWVLNLSSPTQQDGNLDGDSDIDIHDLDLMFAQYGLELEVVS